jgi:hypothetical protein
LKQQLCAAVLDEVVETAVEVPLAPTAATVNEMETICEIMETSFSGRAYLLFYVK